jgi:hypothetical protein
MGKEDRRQKVRIQKSEVRIPAPGNGVDVGELRLRGTEAQEDRSQRSGGRSQEAEGTELPRTPNGEP